MAGSPASSLPDGKASRVRTVTKPIHPVPYSVIAEVAASEAS